jgi:hypothetical protein
MRDGFWFTTFTGTKYFLTDPHPDDVKIEDIAHALSNVARFGGHARVHYSVGQHSELCRQMCKQLYPQDYALQMHCLLHDASEAYIGDVVRPLKVSQPEYLALEEKTMSVIYEALGWKEPNGAELSIIKYIDNAVLLAEARDLITGGGKDWDMVTGVPWKETVVPWTPRTTNFNFLNTYYWLESQIIGSGAVQISLATHR